MCWNNHMDLTENTCCKQIGLDISSSALGSFMIYGPRLIKHLGDFWLARCREKVPLINYIWHCLTVCFLCDTVSNVCWACRFVSTCIESSREGVAHVSHVQWKHSEMVIRELYFLMDSVRNLEDKYVCISEEEANCPIHIETFVLLWK